MHRMAGLCLAKSYVMKNVGKVNLCHRRLASFRLKPILLVLYQKQKTKQNFIPMQLMIRLVMALKVLSCPVNEPLVFMTP